MAALSTENLCKSYCGRQVVRNVSLSLEPGRGGGSARSEWCRKDYIFSDDSRADQPRFRERLVWGSRHYGDTDVPTGTAGNQLPAPRSVGLPQADCRAEPIGDSPDSENPKTRASREAGLSDFQTRPGDSSPQPRLSALWRRTAACRDRASVGHLAEFPAPRTSPFPESTPNKCSNCSGSSSISRQPESAF